MIKDFIIKAFLPWNYDNAMIKLSMSMNSLKIPKDGMNHINAVIFESIKGGCRIFYPDGTTRFIKNDSLSDIQISAL